MNRLALLFSLAIAPVALAKTAGAPLLSDSSKPSAPHIEQRAGLQWNHLSTATHDLELPGPSTEQTGAVVADLDKSGRNGFIVSFRKTAPALVWYRPNGKAWDRYVIDPSYLTVEAGGVVADVDGDGYPDIIFGADYQGDEVWWWENPGGKYQPSVPWKRHIIKKGGAHQHHDQAMADFEGTGKQQLVFWNQGAKKLLIASVPENPRTAEQWDIKEVFSGAAGEGPGKYAEGVIALDVDGDGKPDIVAGNYWFKYEGNGKFKPTRIGTIGGRLAGGNLIKGSKYPQIVINSGDGTGPLKWYECVGDPTNSESWVGHDLAGRDVIHGHSLQIADINGDGNLDIFAAEMAKWTEKRKDSDNPDATAWIFYGDGHGHFRKEIFAKGIGFHEARVADLTGSGRMDILDKPYNWEAPRLDIWLQEPSTFVRANRLSTAAADEARHKINIGLQLYSLRNQFPKDVTGTMKKIHDFGINDVEAAGFYGLSAENFKKDLEAAGLHASGMHAQFPDLLGNFDNVLKDAKTLGVDYVTLPWIPHVGHFSEKNGHEAAMKFNEWGRKFKEAGIHFTYHPHGYEFTKIPGTDETVFDRLVKETDPNFVNFELDIFWAYHGGADPVKLMEKYPTRFVQMHVKDMRKSVKVPHDTGSENVENDVAMGTGQLDIPAILAEAEKIGIKHYYIEDESSHSLEQIPESIAYVRSIGF